MSQGLRVWDASGVLSLDITNRLTKEHSTYSFSIPAYTPTFNIYVPGIENNGTWFVITIVSPDPSKWYGYEPPQIETAIGTSVVSLITHTKYQSSARSGRILVFRA